MFLYLIGCAHIYAVTFPSPEMSVGVVGLSLDVVGLFLCLQEVDWKLCVCEIRGYGVI